ncbi:MerR family transcriptional regulator [Candidatus Leptofilum sp.]|uniref:MerR family transcriptional regulator n=1 Tax=Candidatus Leptofilum sp. TaxID=3241576 RepID=UPI003B59862E
MFRIGEFSRIAQTTVKQLRYYDEIGLFQPEHIDRFTGYRYYRAAQLPDLNRILAMKDLGLTLEQIKRLVADDVSADEIRGMLSLKKAQVEQELHQQIERLHHIEARLRQVEQEGEMAVDDIVLKELPPQPFFSFRETLPHIRKSQLYLKEMKKLLPSRLPKKALSHFAAVYHSQAFELESVDIEIGFLLNEGVDEAVQLRSGPELTMNILPRVETAACAVRVGTLPDGYESYANMGRWMEANGYEMAGNVREVFIVPPNPERVEETVCEIQLPVTLMERPLT